MSRAAKTVGAPAWKRQYDRWLLVLVLVGLLASATILLLRLNTASAGVSAQIGVGRVTVPALYEPEDLSVFERFLEARRQPFQIQDRGFSLLVSDLRVASVNPTGATPIPYEAEVCPWTQHPQPTAADRDTTGDGIPDAWYSSFGLDPLDPEQGSKDPDEDGFTVREEFEAGSNPVDGTDHPSHAVKLRVQRTAARPFGLRFQGIQELAPGDVRYMLNVRGESRSYFAKMGETIRGYTIVGFEPATQIGAFGQPEDASVLSLEGGQGRTVKLTINQDVTIDDRVAQLIYLGDESTYRVKAGDTVTIREQSYKVVDIRRDSVLIHDSGRDQNVTIPMLDPAELPSASANPGDAFEALFEQVETE
jgi:hypothetical protein